MSSTPPRGSLDEDHSGHRPLLSDSGANLDHIDSRDFDHHAATGQGDTGLGQGTSSRSHVARRLTVHEAIKAYPMAVFWSLAVSMCVIMEGFDSILVSNFYAFPTFQRKCTSHRWLQSPNGLLY